MARRAIFTNLKNSGDSEGLVQAAAATDRYQRRQNTAIARGMDPNFCFLDVLAVNIQLLAASATDASLDPSDGVINFGCKSAATSAMADLMMDYKKVNKTIMDFSSYGDYDTNTAPSMSCAVVFHDRAKKKSKRIQFLEGFSADDKDTIEYLEDIAEELDILRKMVQDWYKEAYGRNCGVVARYTAKDDVGFPSRELIKEMVNETLHDETLCDLFISLLKNESYPDLSPDANKLFVEAILNGTFFFKTMSTTAFHYIPELLAFGFPSSKSQACLLNLDLWNDLLERANAQGHSRRDTLALFLLVWAAMDGSIGEHKFTVIIAEDPTTIRFFHDIFNELHQGTPFSINEQHAKSDTEQGKDIVCLTVSTPRKLCSVLLNVLSDDNKYVPRKKAVWLRRHAAAYYESSEKKGPGKSKDKSEKAQNDIAVAKLKPTNNGDPGAPFWIRESENALRPADGTKSECREEIFPGNYPVFDAKAAAAKKKPAKKKKNAAASDSEDEFAFDSDDLTDSDSVEQQAGSATPSRRPAARAAARKPVKYDDSSSSSSSSSDEE